MSLSSLLHAQSPGIKSSRSRSGSSGKRKESEVQKEILQFLSLYPNKVYVWQFRQQARFNPKTGQMFFASVVPGVPDLVGWRTTCLSTFQGINEKAVFLGIEVKTPEGKKAWLAQDAGTRKPDKRFLGQRDFRDRIVKAGGIYLLASSIEDVECLVR